MKIVRLPMDLVAEWRTNYRHPVDDDGTVHEPISFDLEQACTRVEKTARANRRTHELSVVIAGTRYEIAATVERVGQSSDDFLIELRIDGRRVVSARDIICAQMLEQHGECQLRHSNGVIIKIVRDPEIKRTTFKESLQIAPRPEHCPCASWGRAHPGTHHHTCRWNSVAPPAERAPEPEKATTPKKLSALATRKSTSVPTQATAAKPQSVLSSRAVVETLEVKAERNPPASCENGCRSHALPKNSVLEEGQHHPMCPYYEHWKLKTKKSVANFLVDLSTGEKVRPATEQETAEAEVARRRSGSPIVQVDSTPFAVLSEAELNEGESDDSEEKSA